VKHGVAWQGNGVGSVWQAWASPGTAWHGMARRGKRFVPWKRSPGEVWKVNLRPAVWNRDGRRCVRCAKELTLTEAHIDHVQSGKRGTNKLSNLRTLCRRCHVLRADLRHRGLIAKALADGIIPANWRELVWEG
jgi:5-methylcytosine-specific restriction enzyme A